MMNKLAIAAALTAVVAAAGDYPAPAPTTVPVAAEAAVYYYADYDNVVVAAKDKLYYSSALTPEAVERTKQGSASKWSAPKEIKVANLYNAKGATFCGTKYNDKKAPEAGKYGQLFVADEGDAANAGKVVGWEVVADMANPAAVKLQNPWTAYSQLNATPSDVECGPGNGLFIADKGTNAIYWINGEKLAKKEEDAWAAVVPKSCIAAVGEVRSLSYNDETGKLQWTNNDDVTEANKGVFSVLQEADEMVEPVSCDAEMCAAGWSAQCSSKVAKPKALAVADKAWAVADAWDVTQVSKGGKEIYGKADAVIAEVPKEATYAQPADDEKRDVLLVADEKEGAVYAVPQGKAAVKIAEVPNAYGVAYNNGWGWQGEPASASSVAIAAGALLASLAMLL